MSQQLTLRRDYLGANRRLIVSRSVVASVLGLVPVPIFEDWLASQVRRSMIRRIAVVHGVDVDDDAIRALADGEEAPPSWSAIAVGSLVVRSLAKNWRRLFVTYVTTQRARVAAHNFKVATLFDHYCARLHVGLGLDGARVAEVRALIDECIADTRGDLIEHPFRKALVGAAKAGVRTPARLLNLASGGALRRLLERGDEVTAIAEVDDAVDRATDEEDGFVRRTVSTVEDQLTPEANPYLETLLGDFETRWAESRDPS